MNQDLNTQDLSAPAAGIDPVVQVMGGNSDIALDLVVIIDTSGSMSDESADLSREIDAAIEKAAARCPSQLRATFLGIQGTWTGTKFDQSVSDYLINKGAENRLPKPMVVITPGIRKTYAVRLLMPVNILTGAPAPAVPFLCWVMKGWKAAAEH